MKGLTHKFNIKEWEKVENEQSRIVTEIERLIKDEQKTITVLSATGTGKSIMIKKLISQNFKNYYFVIRTLSKCGLEKQLKENLASIDSKNYYIYGDAQVGRKNNKVTFDDIKKVWRKDAGKRPLIYIKDECHIEDNTADSHGYDDFLCKIDFSATPYNEPDVIGNFEHTPMLKKLVEYNRQIESSETDALEQIGKTVLEAVDKLLELRTIYKPYNINPALIIKTSGFFHIDELQLENVFRKNKIKYIYIDQNTAWDDLNELRKNTSPYSIVITKEKIKEGFDMPRAAVCVWTYSNAHYSTATYTQLVGRCRRNAIFLQDTYDIHKVPESLQTSYVFKTHLLRNDDELVKPSDFQYGETLSIVAVKKISGTGEVLVTEKGDKIKYYKKLRSLAMNNVESLGLGDSALGQVEIAKIRVNNWQNSTNQPNYNYFDFYDIRDNKIEIFSQEELMQHYVKSTWASSEISFKRFESILNIVKDMPLKTWIVVAYKNKLWFYKGSTWPYLGIVRYDSEEKFLENFIEVNEEAAALAKKYVHHDPYGANPEKVCYRKIVKEEDINKEEAAKASESLEKLLESRKALVKAKEEAAYKLRNSIRNEIYQLDQVIRLTKKNIRENYKPGRIYVCVDAITNLYFFGAHGEVFIPEFCDGGYSFHNYKKHYEECMEHKEDLDYALENLSPFFFNLMYWQTAFLGVGCTKASLPVKQYLFDNYVVKNEKEILSAGVENTLNFFERDIESAGLIEMTCKVIINSDFSIELEPKLLDDILSDIAIKKTDKIYVISRSKHKDEIFENIIKTIDIIFGLLEKVFDKKEMTLKRKWCIFGNSHFVINDASISIKVKKAISKDDIYQQLLNNKLFGIKKMYLVCPLQNKIFLLDYEENKVKEIKSE